MVCFSQASDRARSGSVGVSFVDSMTCSLFFFHRLVLDAVRVVCAWFGPQTDALMFSSLEKELRRRCYFCELPDDRKVAVNHHTRSVCPPVPCPQPPCVETGPPFLFSSCASVYVTLCMSASVLRPLVVSICVISLLSSCLSFCFSPSPSMHLSL